YRQSAHGGRLSLVAFSRTNTQLDTTFTFLFNEVQPRVDIYHQDITFSFEFALTNFRQQEKVGYSYRLEGYDQSWSEPSAANKISFYSLPSGQYQLRIKAMNSRGQWLPNELLIEVVVHPPWWKTWWAYLLYAGLMAGLAYGVFYFLRKRWELHNRLTLEQQEAQRLKELDHFKSRLYTNLTHEFRTPLTVILGMTGQMAEATQQAREQAARLIERNGQQLLALINQLLDLSKLEDQSFQLNLQQGDIVAYLRYVTESFHTFVNGKNLSLQFHSTIQELVMDFDAEQIQQVMTNLISNAAKFTPSGGDITVQLDRETDAARKRQAPAAPLRIQVKDTGIGIAEAHQPHIFDRFYQVANDTTRTGEGTGIGLAHTHELIKLMGGQIFVSSELGKGTVFTITLPVHRSAPALDEQSLKAAKPMLSVAGPPPDEQATDGANASTEDLPQLLIIEDNPDVVFYLKSCLQGRYQLDVAFNGRIGIEKALANIPDLIISDVMMPEMDGYAVCDLLKNDVRTSHVPIILLTAKADGSSRIHGLRQGADAYLAKPFNQEELLVRLEKLLELRKRLQERYAGYPAGPVTDGHDNGQPHRIDDAFVQQIINIVSDNYTEEDFGLPQLCQQVHMSRSQLFRKMKALMNISPSEYIRNYRLQEAKKLLETGEWNVSEVAFMVGYKQLSHFSKNFQDAFGHPPSETRK
ncbi:MAG: helix-turn-helix domain-containing protein, partial [Lewinella sp.]|nr:helix-turn-helix domain-containing protein [Lewinella sp.]